MIKYPYSDFHELNLDWLLEKVKNNEISIEELEKIVEVLQPGAANLVDRVEALESGDMTIGGVKTFLQNLRVKLADSSSGGALMSLIFQNRDGLAYGRLGARLSTQEVMRHFEAREYSSDDDGTPLNTYEVYRLPDVDANLRANMSYDIITTKNNGEHRASLNVNETQYISSTEGPSASYVCFYFLFAGESAFEYGVIVNGKFNVLYTTPSYSHWLKMASSGVLTRCGVMNNDEDFEIKIVDIFGTAQLE